MAPPSSRRAVAARRGLSRPAARAAAGLAVVLAVAGVAGVALWRSPPPAAGGAKPAAAATPAATTTAGAVPVGPAAPPLPATPPAARVLGIAELLAGHSSDWQVARLRENPAVLVIEFPGLAAQGSAMNRIAALLEKADAPRDRVLADDELAQLIARGGDNAQTFYQGHDYDAEGLARFFTGVQRQRQPLNADEQRLRRLLLAERLVAEAADGSTRAIGTQALITFTATQSDDPSTAVDETIDALRRESVLRHESSHGRFYTRPVYREHCRRLWYRQLDERQRERIRAYLATLGYDRRNEELMLNEAQAFILHTPDTRAFSAAGIGMTEDQLAALRADFWRSLPADGETGR